MLSSDELDAIREGRSGYAVSKKEEPNYPEYEDDDEDEDEEDNEYDEDEDDDEDEGEISSKLEKAMTIGGFIIGAIIICILIFFIAKAAGLVNFGSKKEDDQQIEQEEDLDDLVDENGQVQVPNLVNMTEENALSVLEQMGLKGNKIGESQSDAPAGTIIFQEQTAGDKVDQGTVINYTVSAGTDSPTVPAVTGLSQSEAEAQIKALGLETSIQQSYSDTVPIGKIISVDPAEGTQLSKGATVTLVVSLGEENKQVAVPSVIGQDEATAKKTLNDNGFQVNVETTTESNGVGEGCVASQDIPAGTEKDPGTTITIKIYHAPAASNDPSSQTPSEEQGTGAVVWKCNVKLEQPKNYSGGPVQLSLVQNVNGQNVESVFLEGETITFPYVLSIQGADGVETGTVYLKELVDGTYVERGHYSDVPFKQS